MACIFDVVVMFEMCFVIDVYIYNKKLIEVCMS